MEGSRLTDRQRFCGRSLVCFLASFSHTRTQLHGFLLRKSCLSLASLAMRVFPATIAIAGTKVAFAAPYAGPFPTGVACSSRTSIALNDGQNRAYMQQTTTATYLVPAFTSGDIQRTYTPCDEAATTVTYPGSGLTSSAHQPIWPIHIIAASDTTQREAHDESSSTGIILGATLGPVALLILVCLLVWMCGCSEGGVRVRKPLPGTGGGDDETDNGWSIAATDGSSHWAGY